MINLTESQLQSRNITISDSGKNNEIYIDPKAEIKTKLQIKITGDNNKIHIGRACNIINYYINLKGSENSVRTGIRCRLNGLISCKSNNNTVEIGKFCTLVGVRIEVEYGQSVHIGDDCIFSRGISLRTGDSHSILSTTSKERINLPKSIKIGRHCWIGFGVNIGKGVVLQDNTIVGACSYVAKSCLEGNCIIAGSPAKVVKRDTIWDRRALPENPPEQHVNNMIESFYWDGTIDSL